MSQTFDLNPTPQTVHWGHFDAAIPAVLEVASGDTVIIDTFSGGLSEVADPSLFRPAHQLIVDTVPQILGPHILTGPVHVKGAEPGDTLEVRIIRPLKGALPEDFPSLSRRIIPIDRQAHVARLPWGVDIPLQPFFGIVGVAPPPAYGRVSSVEPREYGGNIDNKEFVPGTSLFLPVFVPGANLSVGDGHAVQGDGEVCLTALETCLKGRFQLIVHKHALNFPRAITPTHYIAMGMDLDPCPLLCSG
jgi:acetamidase/formamidase